MSSKPGNKSIRRVSQRERQAQRAGQGRRDFSPTSDSDVAIPGLVRYGATIVVLSAVTAALIPLRETIGLLNMGLLFLTVVIGATVFAGRGAGLLASFLGFGLFNFFLVPPYYTFAVSDLQNILALLVFLGVSLLLSWLIASAREQARQAQMRAQDVSRLYELSRAIIGAQSQEEILPAIAGKVADVFEAGACWILLPDERQQLVVQAQAPENARPMSRDELSLATWAFWHGREIGQGGTPQDRGPLRTAAFVPLQGATRTVGVLAVADKANNHPFAQAERTVLATFADQAAVALERIYLLHEAQRAEVLARTDELKSALMSAVSHDLRTPLASIIASVTSLMEPSIEWDEETERDFLQGIYDEAKRLNMLVGNLLDMSRIEGGALRPEKDWHSIDEAIGSVIERLEGRLTEHPVIVEIDEGLPLMLFDFSHIDQVLTNLVENAIKYTPPETRLVIRAKKLGEELQVSVEDNGPGVPDRHLPHLFDKFYRVVGGKQKSGTGLGLAISKGLVEAHGGRIWAANRPQGGLSVTFTLPLPESELEATQTSDFAVARS